MRSYTLDAFVTTSRGKTEEVTVTKKPYNIQPDLTAKSTMFLRQNPVFKKISLVSPFHYSLISSLFLFVGSVKRIKLYAATMRLKLDLKPLIVSGNTLLERVDSLLITSRFLAQAHYNPR